MKPIKIGEDVNFRDPFTNQVRVGMIISFDEDTAIVWHDDRPVAVPRENILSYADMAKGKP
jgi:hypothetical protein